MPDNPQPVPGDPSRIFALPNHHAIALEGRDAEAFAHAQFMSDVKSLGLGEWQWSGWLTPKGRVIALFALLKFSAERIGLLLLDAEPEAFADTLRRYVFRSKVAVLVQRQWHACGGFSAPGVATGNAVAGDWERGVELDLGADGGPRLLRVVNEGDVPGNDAALARWTAFDLEHGLPRMPPSQAGQWTPQMLSLQRLRAFSVNKGCYPGQEIVARTHFLGQAKRGLVLLEADVPIAAGREVHDGERALGTVISAQGTLALAVLPLERDATALSADGVALRERPLLRGLAR